MDGDKLPLLRTWKYGIAVLRCLLGNFGEIGWIYENIKKNIEQNWRSINLTKKSLSEEVNLYVTWVQYSYALLILKNLSLNMQ